MCGSLTDAQHDWSTQFCGVDTRPKAATLDLVAIGRGKGSASAYAMGALTRRNKLITDAVGIWRDDSIEALKAISAPSTAASKMILSVVGIVLTVAVPGVGTTFATLKTVASAASGGAGAALGAEDSDAADQAAEAETTIRKCADEAITKADHLLQAFPPLVDAAWEKMTDPESQQQFFNATPKDLLALCEKAGIPVNNRTINQEIGHLRKQLERSLRNTLRDAAVAKQKKALDFIDRALPPDVQQQVLAKQLDDYTTQWAKDYDDKVQSVLDDKDVEYAEGAPKN